MRKIEKRVVTPEAIEEWREMAKTANAKILKSVKRQLTKKDKAILARLNELEKDIQTWGTTE